MTGTSVDYRELLNLQGRIAKATIGVPQAVKRVNRRWVPRLNAMLIAHSSGRPGPEAITGAYNRSYVVATMNSEYGVGATNTSPQSDRLEYGLVGIDRLGRHYLQPPYPHLRPTQEEAAPLYTEDILAAFHESWLK